MGKADAFSPQTTGVSQLYRLPVTDLTTDKARVTFRILPAFRETPLSDPTARNVNVADPTNWVPFRNPHDNWDFTDWFARVVASTYVGHGPKFDFVSPLTFDDGAYCPVSALYEAARNNPEWKYLTDRSKEAGAKIAPLQKPSNRLLMNIAVAQQFGAEGGLGVLNASGAISLVGTGVGLTQARNSVPASSMADPFQQWVTWDVTNPDNGPLLFAKKGGDTRNPNNYQIEMVRMRDGQEVRNAPTHGQLPGRIPLWGDGLRAILNVLDPQEIVTKLSRAFCAYSPTRVHELNLLRDVFTPMGFTLPAAPSAPAASPTVQAGWGSGQPAGAAPAAGGWNVPAAAPAAPAAPAAGGWNVPAAAPSAPAPGPSAPAPGPSAVWGHNPLPTQPESAKPAWMPAAAPAAPAAPAAAPAPAAPQAPETAGPANTPTAAAPGMPQGAGFQSALAALGLGKPK